MNQTTTNGSGASLSTTRLYGSAIALVSGVYSIYLSMAGPAMTGSAWFMLALGVVVVLHGIVLVTPFAARFGAASGPLMVGYAVLMLLNQAWMSMSDAGTSGDMNGMNPMTGGMGWDPGMLAIAVLMLASGVIMTVRRDTMDTRETMAMD